MKGFNTLFVLLAMIFNGMAQEIKNEDIGERSSVSESAFFGGHFDVGTIIDGRAMAQLYNGLAVSDTLDIQFSATVADVCQAKGCWMKLRLDDGKEAMVKFKDYGFFVPKDITGKEVIVNGLAFSEQITVEDQKHYARDAGKSEKEVSNITETKTIYSFEADGVLIRD
ncbi:MAG: DUF4920 domain-containing protein [Saonia sp.]